MNQILFRCNSTLINNYDKYKNIEKLNNNKNKKNNKKNYYFIIIIISITSIIVALCLFIYNRNKKFNNEIISNRLVANYNIISLYSNSIDNYKIDQDLQNNLTTPSNSIEPFIIGLIQIDKINLTYPILSQTSDELLKISPCRFARSYS